mmetsp:Transcript_14740/g.41075  ORF Transcript_14740/g.41075 Transcript_14740/m.41075 type:complete len:102 (-) Transcript_14740:1017-1322(-)
MLSTTKDSKTDIGRVHSGPVNGYNPSGRVRLHKLSKRLVLVVYVVGIGVRRMRSQPPKQITRFETSLSIATINLGSTGVSLSIIVLRMNAEINNGTWDPDW